ncbi:MAG: ABC transporter permease [Candidatus Odinarchaeota archaeon]
MLLTRNFRHYRFSSIIIVLCFFLTLFISTNLPIWIDNQQATFIKVNAREITFHFKLYTSSHLYPNHTLDEELEANSAVKSVISTEHRYYHSIIGSKNSTLDYIQSLPYNSFSGISSFTFSNASFIELNSRMGLNRSSPLNGNEIIINFLTAQRWNLSTGDKFFIAKNSTVIHTPEGTIGSEDPVELSFTVVGILEDSFSDPLFNFIFHDFVHSGRGIRSNVPFVIVSNEMAVALSEAFETGWNHGSHYSYILLDETVIQYEDLKESINQLYAAEFRIQELVGRENTQPYLSHLAIYELMKTYSALMLLQLLFSLLIIPSLVIAFIVLLKASQFWFSARHSELQILYRRGMSEKEVSRQIKGELNQFLMTGFFLAGIGTLAYSWAFEQNVMNSLLMFLLLGVLLMFFFWQLIKSRFMDFSIAEEKPEWKMKKQHYLIIAIGLLPLVLELANIFSLLQIGFLATLEQTIAPLYPFLIILTPLFGLYGSGLLVFAILSFNADRISHKIRSRFILQDISRNATEIFQIIVLLSLSLTIALGPVVANDMIADYDRRQLEASYGAEFTTGFLSSIGNYTVIKENLDLIDSLNWAVVMELEGQIHRDTANGASFDAKILLASDNYFQVLMPACKDRLLGNLQETFESSRKIAFLQQKTLESEFFEYSNFIDILFVDLYYEEEFNPVQHTFGGSFSYIPGAFVGFRGYTPPFVDPSIFGSYQQNNIIFAHLIDEYLTTDITSLEPSYVNFLFDLSNAGESDVVIDQIQHVVGVSLERFSETLELDVYGKQPQTRVLQALFLILSYFNLALVILFLLVFFQSYLLQRRLELGIFRARGYSKSQIYRLLTGEFLLVIIGGIIWSVIHLFLYGLSIANYAIYNKLFPPRILLQHETILSFSFLFLVLILLGIIRPLLLYRHKLPYLLQRRT